MKKTPFLAAVLASAICAGSALAVPSVQFVREVQQLPVIPNNGRVFGHDVGWSVRWGTDASYFFFGDTLVDTNNDGTPEAWFGTFAARTFDLDASDGISLTYRIGNPSNHWGNGNAVRIIPPIAPEHPCLWPRGAVANVDFKMYLYFEAYTGCGSGYLGTGLALLDGDLQATRVGGGYFFGPTAPPFGTPIQATDSTPCGAVRYVYLFGIVDRTQVMLARVPEAQIEDPTKYSYWGFQNGTNTWVTDVSLAVPIFQDTINEIYNGVSVAFNETMNRYLAIYSCGPQGYAQGAYEICARWANTTGAAPAALIGGWSAPQVVFDDCNGPLFTCYQAFQHDQFAAGNKIYVTSARNIGSDYYITLREFQVSP